VLILIDNKKRVFYYPLLMTLRNQYT